MVHELISNKVKEAVKKSLKEVMGISQEDEEAIKKELQQISEKIREKSEQLCLSLKDTHEKMKKDLEDFLIDVSHKIDKIILKSEEKENIEYIAGELLVEAKDSVYMQLTANLFFKDQNGNFIHKVTSSDLMEMNFYLKPEAIGRIFSEPYLKYELSKPKA